MTQIGLDLHRKEAGQKVSGEAKYTDDFTSANFLHARMAVSPYPHARILSICTQEALAVKGVKLVLTGKDHQALSGPLICDRPLLAQDTVRYAGEPVALVVAQDEAAAIVAAEKIQVNYEILPAVFDPYISFMSGSPIIHTGLSLYTHTVDDVYPQNNSNICSHYPIRKGDMTFGWQNSVYLIEREYKLPSSGHIAMELRTAQAQILHDGTVNITTSSQSPYEVVKQISACFGIPAGKIRVRVPFVGGGFGGKAPVMLELLACLASQQLAGRAVRLVITRSQDMITLPSRIGLWAKIKLGTDKNGLIQAADLQYIIDNGAYADISPYMAKAVAVDCSGPYNIENLTCDAYSVYTNRTYATSFRSYAHESLTFCLERAIDELAYKLNIDPLELRYINAICPGNQTPTQVISSYSNVGNLRACINELKTLSKWSSVPNKCADHIIRAQGCACFWKSPTPPLDAVSGAIVTVNSDGTFNLSTGAVEMGSGGQSLLAQMFADRLGITTDQVHVDLAVDTRLNPEHYKTVASFTTYMAGRAVMRAADDVIAQIKFNASLAFNCALEDIEIGGGCAYLRQEPARYLLYKDLLAGYSTPDSGSVGEPVIGSGGFMLKGLSALDRKTGKGKSAPSWTVGAQIVEIELDTRYCSYKILKAITVMDIGKVLNSAEQQGLVKGGMAMGLSIASRESFAYENGLLKTPSLRTYKLMHYGQHPEYKASFIETPQDDAPYGARPMSEHGIIGIPAALANALSSAAGIVIDTLPVTPELLWQTRNGGMK